MTTTPNIKLNLPDFDISPWHDELNNNFRAIDAIFKSTFGIDGLLGIWLNSTIVTVGQRYFDTTNGFYYQVAVAHTTPAAPTTFAASRAANPTYWTPLDASAAIQAVADAAAIYADVLVSQTAVNNNKVIVAADKAIVAADKATVAADKAIVAADKASVTTLYDNFDDRYLGAKAIAPVLDNDGAALLTGALYFDTVAAEMRVWNGSAWVAAYIATADYNLFRAGAEQENGTPQFVGSARSVVGGLARSTAPSTAGLLKIALPLTTAATGQWIAFWVDTIDYATDETRSYYIGGYISSGGWLAVSASQVAGQKQINARFGHDGTNMCVTLGDVTDTWAYPIIRIRDVTGNTGANWTTLTTSSWSMSITTTPLSTINHTKQIAAVIPDTSGVIDSTSDANTLTGYGGWHDMLAISGMANMPAARKFHLEFLRHSSTLGLQIAWPAYDNSIDAPWLRRLSTAWGPWRMLAWEDSTASLSTNNVYSGGQTFNAACVFNTVSPTAITPTAGDNTTKIATTAFVTTADNLKANLASPTFTGVPAAPTAAALTNTTQLATTAFVTTADNLKANLAGPTFTGVPAAPTAAPGTNTTQVATTAFVAAATAAIDFGAGNAALALGAIGSYVWAYRFGTGITAGSTYAGSTLEPAGANGAETVAIADDAASTATVNLTKGGAALTGTWRAVGQSNIASASNTGRYCLFLRIS